MARNLRSNSGGCATKKRGTSQEEDAQPCMSGLEGLGTLEPGTAVQFVESRFRTALDAFRLLPIALQRESRGRIKNMLADLLADTPSSRVAATQTNEEGLAFPLAKLPDTAASRVLSYLSLGDLFRVHRVSAHCKGLVESALRGSTITVSQDQFQRQALLQGWSTDFPTALSGFLSSHGSKLRKLVVILSYGDPAEMHRKVAGFIGDYCENIVDLGYYVRSCSGYLYRMFNPEQFMRLGRLKNLIAGLQIKSLEGFNLVQHRLQNVKVETLIISQEVLDEIMATPDRGLTATSQCLVIPKSSSFASSKLAEMVRFERLILLKVNCTKFLNFLPQGLTSLWLYDVTSVFNASDLELLSRLSNITEFLFVESGPDCCIGDFRFLQAYKCLRTIVVQSHYFDTADFLRIPTQAPLVSVDLYCKRVSSDSVLTALLARKCRLVRVILKSPVKVCEDSPVWKLLSQCRQSLLTVDLFVERDNPRFDFRSMLNQLSVHLLHFRLSGSWSVSAADQNGFLTARRLIVRDPVRTCAPLRMILPLANWEKASRDETIDRARLAGVELISCD